MQLRPYLVAVLLTAACSTDTLVNDKVLPTGPECVPPADLADSGGLLVEWHLPLPDDEPVRVRVDGLYMILGPEDPEYNEILQSGGGVGAAGILAGDHQVEVVRRDGTVLASAVVTIPRNDFWEKTGPDFQTIVRFYGDLASPQLFVSNWVPSDQSLDTTDATVRNGLPTGETLIVSRCVLTSDSDFACEDLGTVAAGATFHTTVQGSDVLFPFVGEAWLRLRIAGDEAVDSYVLSINRGTGCQAASVLVYDAPTLPCNDGRRSLSESYDCTSIWN